MWAILKSLILQGIIARTALRSLGWLAWLLPVGFLLKWVGLPILMVLGVLLTVGVALAKFIIPVVIVVVALRWMLSSDKQAQPAMNSVNNGAGG